MKRIEVFRVGLIRKGWAFRFVADNGEIVAQSETYRRRVDAVESAERIKSGWLNAPVEWDYER